MLSFSLLKRTAQVCALLLLAFLAAGAQSQQSDVAAPAPSQSAPAPQSASVVIVLDNSAAAKSSLNDLEKGVAAVAAQFGSDHEVALMTAGGQPTLAQEFTGDTELITRALKAVRPVGTLDLYSAIAQAVRHVNSDAANDRTAVIAFVKELNANNASSTHATVLESANKDKPVPIYIVSLRRGDWAVQDEVQRVSVMSGGAAYAPAKPADFPYISRTVASRLGATEAPAEQRNAASSARPLKSYNALLVREVPVVENKDTTEMAGGENLLFQRMLVSRLQRAKLFPTIWQGGVVSDDAEHADSAGAFAPGSELEMLATVVGFRRGNRAARQFAPAFGGAARMRVQVILRDRATKETLATFTEQGSHRSGFLGGTDEKVQAEAMMEVSNKIVAHLKKLKNSR